MVRQHQPARNISERQLPVQALLSLMGKNRDKLNDTLTDQQKEILAKYDDVVNEMHSLAEVKSFTCGFSLDIRLMMENISIELTANE